MRRRGVRGLLPWIGGALGLTLAAVVIISHSHSSITRPRLERSLPATFSNLYVQQAQLLGHKGITARSLHAKAQCDRGGPNVADQGAGADWLCYMTWHDPNVDETLMPGKFEVNAHSNNCYTAGGPSKLVGLLTITDLRGRDALNPVFEFDGCFDPKGSNEPTGVEVAPTSTSPTGPASLTVATGAVTPDVHGTLRLRVTCSTGQEGCGGTIAPTFHGARLAPVTYALAPGSAGTVDVELGAPPRSGGTLLLELRPVIGDTGAQRVALPIDAG